MKDDVELTEEDLEEEEYADNRNIFEKISDLWKVVRLVVGIAMLLRLLLR